MSRATVNIPDGFTGIELPLFGPRAMGQPGKNPPFVGYLNDLTTSLVTMHDNQTDVRPSYLPANGLWAYTDGLGAKHVYQYTGSKDVKVWEIDADGKIVVSGSTEAATANETIDGLSEDKFVTPFGLSAWHAARMPPIPFREVMTASGSWIVPDTGLYLITCVGAGGSGGAWLQNTLLGGLKGGDTTFSWPLETLAAAGGSGGGGGVGGGGGGAGRTIRFFAHLKKDWLCDAVIGAGAPRTTYLTGVKGGDGEGSEGGRIGAPEHGALSSGIVAGTGAVGAGTGSSTWSEYTAGAGGNGGSNGTGYGGGGGGAGNPKVNVPFTRPGRGADGGEDGAVYTGAYGGGGGNGAIIMEFLG